MHKTESTEYQNHFSLSTRGTCMSYPGENASGEPTIPLATIASCQGNMLPVAVKYSADLPSTSATYNFVHCDSRPLNSLFCHRGRAFRSTLLPDIPLL